MNDNWNKPDFEIPESEPEQTKEKSKPTHKDPFPIMSFVLGAVELALFGIAFYHLFWCTQ